MSIEGEHLNRRQFIKAAGMVGFGAAALGAHTMDTARHLRTVPESEMGESTSIAEKLTIPETMRPIEAFDHMVESIRHMSSFAKEIFPMYQMVNGNFIDPLHGSTTVNQRTLFRFRKDIRQIAVISEECDQLACGADDSFLEVDERQSDEFKNIALQFCDKFQRFMELEQNLRESPMFRYYQDNMCGGGEVQNTRDTSGA